MRVGPFVCLGCRQSVLLKEDHLECPTCGTVYPIVGGVPVLLPENNGEELAVCVGRRVITLEQVQVVYDKTYRNPGMMGTDLDCTYDATTKQMLLGFAGPLEAKRLLDVGCGMGSLWDHVSPQVEGCALDVSIVGARVTAQRHPELAVSVSVAEYLPYPDNYFQCIIAADTVEHTFSPSVALEEMRRVLEPGGHFCASFPVPNSLRKWGLNQLIQGHVGPLFLARLVWILIQRTILFGRPDFQPIDRDKTIEDWTDLLAQTGFQISQVLEWPFRPQIPIVYLVHAVPDKGGR